MWTSITRFFRYSWGRGSLQWVLFSKLSFKSTSNEDTILKSSVNCKRKSYKLILKVTHTMKTLRKFPSTKILFHLTENFFFSVSVDEPTVTTRHVRCQGPPGMTSRLLSVVHVWLFLFDGKKRTLLLNISTNGGGPPWSDWGIILWVPLRLILD